MRRKKLLTLLAEHAEALNEGGDAFDSLDWLKSQPLEAQRVLPLLKLAEAVKRVLVPVRPSPQFRHHLRQRLNTPATQSPMTTPSSTRWVWWSTAVLGTLLSVTGLSLFLWRRNASPSGTPTAV